MACDAGSSKPAYGSYCLVHLVAALDFAEQCGHESNRDSRVHSERQHMEGAAADAIEVKTRY
jgi:hypothetical protein